MPDSSPAKFYDEFAELYHLSYEDWNRSVERQGRALDAILRSRGVSPPAAILDAACGIGSQALGLASLGYDITGSDISAGAIKRARAEATIRGLSIDFSTADMREVARHHNRTFDVVLACDNSVPHLLSDDEILEAFRALHACTAPGGLCVILADAGFRDSERVDGAFFQPVLIGHRAREA